MVHRLLGVAYIVVVRQHDPLRIGRRARGVGDIGQAVGLHRCHPLLHLFPVRREQGITQLEYPVEEDLILLRIFHRIEQDVAFHRGEQRFHGAQLRDLLVGGQHHHRVGVVDAEGDILLRLQLYRKRHADRPGVEYTQLSQHPVVLPLRDERHPLPCLKTESHQARREAERLLLHFTVGNRVVITSVSRLVKEGALSMFLYRLLQQRDDCFSHNLFIV